MNQSASAAGGSMESVQVENRKFPPPADLAAEAHVGSMEEYEKLYARSIEDPEGFWGEHAPALHWFKKWDRVLEWNLPDAKWFVGGKTNLCYNCVDRQVDAGLGDQTAIVWEGEPIGPTASPRCGTSPTPTSSGTRPSSPTCSSRWA